ncbi:MAG: phosphoglycerate kinase [Opitutales bacterium]|nr:phosphoglycerate kinase [Opitutales bacterium]
MATKTIRDIAVSGKRCFVRCDFNVPLDDKGNITDDTRIKAALPTIRHLIENNAKVILASHLGRPKGKDPKLTLAPIAKQLSAELRQPVVLLPDSVGAEVEAAVSSMEAGQVVLLENVRFYSEEKKDAENWAANYGKFADVFVNDAFGTAHRFEASTAGIAKYVDDSVCGFLIERELQFLGDKTSNPERPFTVILGGAKVSDKITVIDALLEKADSIMIGGAMAYTFMLAMGGSVGSSLNEPDKIETAQAALNKAKERGVKFLLPIDHVITQSVDFGALTVTETKVVEGNIPEGWQGVDIGPKTLALFQEEVAKAKTVLWNGPMGIFEIKDCNKGTFAVAETIANSSSTSIIGGGDSVKAIKKSGYSDRVTFMSTGGGASLEFLEGKVLPGVDALDKA